MLEILSTPEAWVSLATLIGLEIILGIDNIVFITLLAGRLPQPQRHVATRLGLAGALVTRLLLLFALSWVMRLSAPLFTLVGHSVTGRDLILILGGLFLVAKATIEIYDKVEAVHPVGTSAARAGSGRMASIIVQIMLLDIVFSFDSVITAVGMVAHVEIMVIAVIVSIAVMLIFAAPIGDFVEKHPSIKILALSFLVMIGVLLIAEGTGQHFERGYVYFAMMFALGIELLNMRYRAKAGALTDQSA